MMEQPKVGFVNGRSLELARMWAIEDFVFELQQRLAREINVARNAQRSADDEETKTYFEGYADALGDVILKIEDLRKELRRLRA
ncbi:MAG: hypothetical protein ACXQTW_00690 [Candidatus Methanospirareceae archaeon]